MLSEGADAPAVSLPAYVDGERRQVDLDEYLGDGIVVLAFYPADFNPACTMQTSDLGDLDLFTMQKDVSVFGVSPDSTYSHEAFAERYGLNVPLLSDRAGTAADAYDVAMETETGESLVQRAVFVVDHRGTVQYAWGTDDLEATIDVRPVKEAVGDIGGDDTALERYRVGHEKYVAGRQAFTDAMAEYEDREWMDARSGFEAAEPHFTAAADHFDTAVRFAETADFETVVDRTQEKADTLSHAASWLADSADALSSGRGKQGSQYRDDAQRLLDTASDLSEPPEPDAFALTGDGIDIGDAVVVEPEDDGDYDWRADDGDPVDADLAVDDADLDAAVAEGTDEYAETAGESDTVEGDLEMNLDAVDATDDDALDAADAADADSESSVEGDTVEGDLEMNLYAVEASEGEGTDGDAETTAGDAETSGGPTTAGGAPDGPTGEGDGAGVETTASGDETGAESGDAVGEDGETGDDGPGADGSGDADADDDEDVEELDLVDPTEGADEEETDERADWDIPGR
ncbi:redoxin domain-containing protein [Halosimplex salinum]|uniref:redoxin domain-containing protein n=1 Tax=Halosimplex salinum TaxID=1710538 RepID=UPI000F4935E3|nr:redoxin domain-containing protein [Halosimplex salinum]